MKRFIALLLSLLVLFSLALPAFAAADASESAAQGFAYLYGQNVAQDNQKALQHFLEAAEAGSTEALFPLGEMYEYGLGTDRSLSSAAKWYIKAAEAGSSEAQEKLSKEPLKTIAEAMGVQEQLTTTPTAAYNEPTMPAVNSADTVRQAYAYLRGEGVAQDYEKALNLLLEAERNGDTSVLFPIGEIFEQGLGRKKNLVKAVEYYQSAQRAGSAEAAEKLRQEPLRTVAEAMSVQTQSTTQVTGEYAEPEFIRGSAYPFYLDRPIIDLTICTMVLTFEEWISGWPFGNWYVYVRDNSGHWHHTAVFDLDNKIIGPGQTISYELTLDGPETFNAIAICPADKGMDYVVRLSPIFIVPERNVGEYSSSLLRPSYTPVDPSTMRPQSTHQVTSVYKNPTGPSFDEVWDDYGVCFVAGTPIHTEAGLTPIEEIKPGDLVWSWNELTDKAELKPVVETYINPCTELLRLSVCGEVITCTPQHRFYVPQKGWTRAYALRAGDELVLLDGETVILDGIQHDRLESSVNVYNFQVEDTHSYYVGKAGVRAHNANADGTSDFYDYYKYNADGTITKLC